ncbi:MAG: NAD(P)H-dependent oxidoreductase [Armatimonadota bacterium]
MTQKSVLIILGHPQAGSFNEALAKSYHAGAVEAGASAEILRVSDLEYAWKADPRPISELEPALIEAQHKIKQADHVVWVYPLWWGSAPAALKSFVDRVFISGFAMQYESGKALPKKLLIGKTSRIIITMDAPSYWHALMYKRSGTTWLRWATLWFSGFKTTKAWEVAGVRESTSEQRETWLAKARAMGVSEGRA